MMASLIPQLEVMAYGSADFLHHIISDLMKLRALCRPQALLKGDYFGMSLCALYG
jgi:hypothetical protein